MSMHYVFLYARLIAIYNIYTHPATKCFRLTVSRKVNWSYFRIFNVVQTITNQQINDDAIQMLDNGLKNINLSQTNNTLKQKVLR